MAPTPAAGPPPVPIDEVLDQPVPRRVLTLTLLAVGLMLAMTTWFSTSAVLPTLRERWAMSTGSASLLVVILQLGFVAGALMSAGLGLADHR